MAVEADVHIGQRLSREILAQGVRRRAPHGLAMAPRFSHQPQHQPVGSRLHDLEVLPRCGLFDDRRKCERQEAYAAAVRRGQRESRGAIEIGGSRRISI